MRARGLAPSSPACGPEGCLELTGVRAPRAGSELPRAHRRAGPEGCLELTGVRAPRTGSELPRALRRARAEDRFELTACPALRAAPRSPLWLWEAEAGASASTTEHVFAIRLDPSYICES